MKKNINKEKVKALFSLLGMDLVLLIAFFGIELYTPRPDLDMFFWAILGVINIFLLFLISPIHDKILKKLVESDIRDLKNGKVWTPFGYKNIKDSYEELSYEEK